ncbi:hypothetical protein NDU88_007383 [Pleurodeles waltl]|uniref:Uncharacterized protein n=1 Tax=Pleurodeles waltl TaxID=8319 RepID=A0AAV7PL45_PLEWA|nr:hypothetical protein NDU88_007383 [Pleurodeles waltl]
MSPQPQGRGSPGGHEAARAARAAARLSSRSGPRTHSRSRHSTLAGNGLSPPHLLTSKTCTRAEASVRPACATPGPSTGLGRSHGAQNVTGAPPGYRPGPPPPQPPAG